MAAVEALARSLGNLTNLVRSQEKILLELMGRQELMMKSCEGAFREINERLDAMCPRNMDANNNHVDGVAPTLQDIVAQRQETYEEQKLEEQKVQEMQHAGENAAIAEELTPAAPVVEEGQPPAGEPLAAPPMQRHDPKELLAAVRGSSHLPPVDAKDPETFLELGIDKSQQSAAPPATQDGKPPAVPVEDDWDAPPYSQHQQTWNNGGAAQRGNGAPRGANGGPRGGGHPGSYGPRSGGNVNQAPQGFAKPAFGNGDSFNGNNKPSAAPSNNNGSFSNAPASNPSSGFANSGFGNGGGFNRQQQQQHRAAPSPRDNGFQQQPPQQQQQQNRPFATSGAAPPPRGGYCLATRGRGVPRNAFHEQR